MCSYSKWKFSVDFRAVLVAFGCALGAPLACDSGSQSGTQTPPDAAGTGGDANGGHAGGAAMGGSAGAVTGGVGGAAGSVGGIGGSGAEGGVGGSGALGGAGSGGAAGSVGGAGGSGGSDPNACGYKQQGRLLQVNPEVEVCLAPVVCTPETCPPQLGECVNGQCVFKGDYRALETLPEAWATQYCDLSTAGCHGVSQIEFAEVVAAKIGEKLGAPLCTTAAATDRQCIGIVASSPLLAGNSEVTLDPATGQLIENWGLGMTEATGFCYELTGPGGTATVALTDRCAGYCRCAGSAFQECGACVNSTDLEPNCPCVGTVPGIHDACCGRGCATTAPTCDWCASSNHPHFDVDDHTFRWVCGADAMLGSCKLTKVRYIACLNPNPNWPPDANGHCKAGSYQCFGTPAAHHELVPGSSCCCNWDLCPGADGTCAAPASTCKVGSCSCGPGQPDADHPEVPSTGCCCIFGTKPQADGSCQ